MEHLVRVIAPHFVAGIIFRGGTVVRAAPILGWVRHYAQLSDWCRRKGYLIHFVHEGTGP